jgi:hypothetical protein
MRVVMMMRWDGVTPEEYDQVRGAVGWESDVPRGAVLHLACFDRSGMSVTDVWESAEDFQAFVDQRLMPKVKEAGISGEPEVQVTPLHALFAPAFERTG